MFVALSCACGSGEMPTSIDVVEATVGDVTIDAENIADSSKDSNILDVPKDTLPLDIQNPDVPPATICASNDDCLSGVCIETPDGKQCATFCITSAACAPGLICVSAQMTGSDVMSVCVHPAPRTCLPCSTTADCVYAFSANKMECVGLLGPHFCLPTCETGICPLGYTCGPDQDGQPVCLPDGGQCNCTALGEGTSGKCGTTNEYGTCSGEFTCTDGEIGDCSASVPKAEECNNEDDDCDGKVDNDVSTKACALTNPYGICPGKTLCIGGNELCLGNAAFPEMCNGLDDDCDGETDEDLAGCRTPVAYPVFASTTRFQPVTITLNAVAPEDKPITGWAIVETPATGTLSEISNDHKVVYTPDTGYTGEISFTYKAGNIAGDSNVAVISVVVLNHAPLAVSQDIVVRTHKTVLITLSASDLDEGDPLTNFFLTSLPTHGTLGQILGNKVTYTSDNCYTGHDELKFRARDGLADSAEGTVSLTVESERLYVDQGVTGGDGKSWATAFDQIADAITDSECEDEIWVAGPYTYKPTTGTDRTVSFMIKNGLKVYGGLATGAATLDGRDFVANETKLSGDIGTVGDAGDNSCSVVMAGGTMTLDGFTIEKGNAGPGCSDNRGGGLFIMNGAGFVVSNCTFVGNSSGEAGGAIYSQSASLTISHCTFRDNVSISGDGGGVYIFSNSPAVVTTISQSNFAGNSGWWRGGGLHIVGSGALVVRESMFIDNSLLHPSYEGGSIFIQGGGLGLTVLIEDSMFVGTKRHDGNYGTNGGAVVLEGNDINVQIARSIFAGNQAVFGGAILQRAGTTLVLTDGLIVGNQASGNGGGIYRTGSSADTLLLNLTVAGNQASIGGGLYVDNGSPKLINSILWGDTGGEVCTLSNCTSGVSVSYSDVSSGYQGTGNINQDPKFVVPTNGTGTWAATPTFDSLLYQTTLTTSDHGWLSNAMTGKFLKPKSTDPRQYPIVVNTASTVTILGNVTDFVASGDAFAIYDYHLQSTSPCKDAGMPHDTTVFDYLDLDADDTYDAGTDLLIRLNGYTPESTDLLMTTDFDGNPRLAPSVNTPRIDIGAYELN